MTLNEIFPNGCSYRQMYALRDYWFEKHGKLWDWPKRIHRLDEMLSAVSMLASCFAYGNPENYYKNFKEKYYKKYLANFLERGGNKVDFDDMLKRQRKHYKKCRSGYAGSDLSGCGYNTIIESDEFCKLKLNAERYA